MRAARSSHLRGLCRLAWVLLGIRTPLVEGFGVGHDCPRTHRQLLPTGQSTRCGKLWQIPCRAEVSTAEVAGTIGGTKTVTIRALKRQKEPSIALSFYKLRLSPALSQKPYRASKPQTETEGREVSARCGVFAAVAIPLLLWQPSPACSRPGALRASMPCKPCVPDRGLAPDRHDCLPPGSQLQGRLARHAAIRSPEERPSSQGLRRLRKSSPSDLCKSSQ